MLSVRGGQTELCSPNGKGGKQQGTLVSVSLRQAVKRNGFPTASGRERPKAALISIPGQACPTISLRAPASPCRCTRHRTVQPTPRRRGAEILRRRQPARSTDARPGPARQQGRWERVTSSILSSGYLLILDPMRSGSFFH